MNLPIIKLKRYSLVGLYNRVYIDVLFIYFETSNLHFIIINMCKYNIDLNVNSSINNAVQQLVYFKIVFNLNY